MASLLGFLGALGNSLGVGDANQPNALTRLNDAADPVAAAQRQEATQQQGALAALNQNRANGVVDPVQNLKTVGQFLPQYTQAAAQVQAQNPLGALLQGNGNNPSPMANLSGDPLLNALPPAIAADVKATAEGRKAPPNGYAMKTPYGQQFMALVAQYDPSFDMVNFNARASTRKDFTSGKSAQNITAMNTALGHLGSLSDAYDKLGNTDYGWLNSAKNATESFFGDKGTQASMADVQSKAHAVSEELAKVFRSTGMAESDVKAWEKQITTSATPAESKAVIGAAVDLLNSRLDSLGQQYNQGMGTTKQGIELLSPHAQDAYKKLTGVAPAETGVTGNLAADNARNATAAAPQVQEGATATNPKTGAKIVFKNGKWGAAQ